MGTLPVSTESFLPWETLAPESLFSRINMKANEKIGRLSLCKTDGQARRE
jgi:hypothetical protein